MKAVICTKYRGVFFGELIDREDEPAKVVVEDCRMCVYWSKSERGVLGLASAGPSDGCRISVALPRATLYDVTAIFEASPEASERWEAAPWSE